MEETTGLRVEILKTPALLTVVCFKIEQECCNYERLQTSVDQNITKMCVGGLHPGELSLAVN